MLTPNPAPNLPPHLGHADQLAWIGDLLVILAHLLLALHWIAAEMCLENESASTISFLIMSWVHHKGIETDPQQ